MLPNFPIKTIILMCPQQFIGCVYWGFVLLRIASQSRESLGAQYAVN